MFWNYDSGLGCAIFDKVVCRTVVGEKVRVEGGVYEYNKVDRADPRTRGVSTTLETQLSMNPRMEQR